MDSWWAPFVDRPDGAGIFLDFDGTLALIVDDPAEARPLPGAVEILTELATRYRIVAVVSGRPVPFLASHFGATGVVLVGQYGLEEWRDGRSFDHPDSGGWREVVAAAADRADAELAPDVGVERKGLSVTLHVRVHPEHAGDVESWVTKQADETGLVVHRARRSWELRPPVSTDKGTVVAALADGLHAACFVGDDHGDLPAFAALDRLAEKGLVIRKVAVASVEAPPELVRAADRVVDGPVGVLALLRSLADAQA